LNATNTSRASYNPLAHFLEWRAEIAVQRGKLFTLMSIRIAAWIA